MGSEVVVTRRDEMPHRLRCSLRYSENPGSGPTVIGWPFAWIEINADTLTFSAGKLVPFGRPRWAVPKDSLIKIERSSGGLRFYADGISDPWIAGSLFPKRFIRKLVSVGLTVPDDPIVGTKWDSI